VKSAARLAVLLFAAGFLAAGTASAQFVPLARCHAAFPCSIPFGLQYGPDPLIAGPYAHLTNTAVSARMEIATPPRFELDRPLDQKALDEALRKTLEIGRSGKPAEAMRPPRNPPPKR
jgi:hypothetical protein